MKDLNCVQLIGRLGQDPDVHYTDHGIARTTFSVATNRTWTDADGQAQTETEWHRITAWGKLAELCAQFLAKGTRGYVEGHIDTTRWEDAETGAYSCSGIEIVIPKLMMLDGRGTTPVEDTNRQRIAAPASRVPDAPRRPVSSPADDDLPV